MPVPVGLDAKLRLFGARSHEPNNVPGLMSHCLVQVMPDQEESIYLEKSNARSHVIEVPNSQNTTSCRTSTGMSGTQ